MKRIFVTTASARSGSTILSWLISQHSFLKSNPIYEHYFISKSLNQIIDTDIEKCNNCINYYDTTVNKFNNEYSGAKLLNLNAYNKLLSTFPTNPVINLVRNPFDWYYSCKVSVKKKNPEIIDNSVAWWFTRHIKPSLYNYLEHNSQIKLIYFEDVILDHNTILTDIFKFLEIPVENVDLTGATDVYSTYTSHSIDHITDGLQTSVINKGIKQLPMTDVVAISNIIQKDDRLKFIFERYLKDL